MKQIYELKDPNIFIPIEFNYYWGEEENGQVISNLFYNDSLGGIYRIFKRATLDVLLE